MPRKKSAGQGTATVPLTKPVSDTNVTTAPTGQDSGVCARSKKPRMKFYSLKNILAKGCQYNVIFGERSNGKTYACLEYALKRYCETKETAAYVRRWQDDFKGKRGLAVMDGILSTGLIEKYTEGKWNNVKYQSGRWTLCKYDSDLGKDVLDERPFCYSFAISAMEHDKSTNYESVTTIIFDEFLTRGYYLPNEFVDFMNTLSTIIRYRSNVKIFMLGNTVNQYCPYFAEMGLVNIKKMKKGDIDVYDYGDSKLHVAVEYADSPNKGKPSDVYFAFDNPKLHMITGGAWELAIYPHCPFKYSTKEILYRFFIQFNGDTLQCEVVQHHEDSTQVEIMFIFIHRKTTDLKDEFHELVYSPEQSPYPSHRRRITKPYYPVEKRIWTLFQLDKVFYQDNEVGEIVRNYIVWCKGASDLV